MSRSLVKISASTGSESRSISDLSLHDYMEGVGDLRGGVWQIDLEVLAQDGEYVATHGRVHS